MCECTSMVPSLYQADALLLDKFTAVIWILFLLVCILSIVLSKKVHSVTCTCRNLLAFTGEFLIHNHHFNHYYLENILNYRLWL